MRFGVYLYIFDKFRHRAQTAHRHIRQISTPCPNRRRHFRQISTLRTGAVHAVRSIDTAPRLPANTFDKFRHRAQTAHRHIRQISTPRTGRHACRPFIRHCPAAAPQKAPPRCPRPTKKPLNCRHPVSAAR